MQLNIIAAIDEINAIGKDNKLLCHLRGDLQNFKKLTLHQPVIMGRKTYESLPNGALPNRLNIVVSNSLVDLEDAIVVHSPKEAFEVVKNREMAFVLGGETIYKEFFDYADNLYITKIRTAFKDADAFFPEIDIDDFSIRSISDEFPKDENNDYPYFFINYQRLKGKKKF